MLLVFLLSLLGVPTTSVWAATTITFTGEELLGKPEDTSITINIVPATTIEYHYQYGTAPGSYTDQTANYTATGGQPHEIVISGLSPNTQYYYRMQYHAPGDAMDDWVNRSEHSFWTQRAASSSFSFIVTSDSHENFNTSTQNAMTNIRNEQPDFLVDLGDTFLLDGSTTQTAVNNKYLAYREPLYFDKIGNSVPIFLASGNHEDEEGWNLDDSFSLAQASIQARKLYYPTPIDDGFYSGNTDILAAINAATYGDQYREDYYAWTWGDALFVVIDEFQYTMQNPYGSTAGEGSDDPATGDQWNWTLGQPQYNWLKQTLENSDAKYKFVFSHNMLGGIPRSISVNPAGYVRGGAEAAEYFEWGGKNADGTDGFEAHRPGWGGVPIHQLFVQNGVSAYFHGHDHQYVHETRDGIVYEEVPSPGMSGSGFSGIYTAGDHGTYNTIRMLASPGHLRISVTPTQATVDYISSSSTSGTVNYTYSILPSVDPDYTITASAGANGSISPSGAVGVVANANQSFTITPAAGYQVAGVQVDGVSVGAMTNYTFTNVTADHTISASFAALPQFTITASAGANGSINPSGAVSVSQGGNQAFTITPNGGYQVDDVLVDGASVGAVTTYTFSSVQANHTIAASFEAAQVVPVTLDGAVSSNTAASGSSLSIPHTTGTGTNRLMLVGISWNAGSTDRTISSVTFTPSGGSAIALSLVRTQQAGTQLRYSAIYSLLNPPSGQAGTVAITFSGSVSNGIMAGAANFAGVNQSTPLGNPGGAGPTSQGTTPTVTLTGLNGNELVFDHVFMGASSSSQTLTVGSGQTQLWYPAYVANLRAAASTEQATGSSVTMSWTAASSAYWAIAAVPINPATAGTTYNLTVAVDPVAGGTTTPAVGVHSYPENEVVNISATPAAGYAFDHWSGDCTGAGSCSVTMSADRSVTAHFSIASTPITFTGTELLGRLEADSASISVVPDSAISLYYEYGTDPGSYSGQTTTTTAAAGTPKVVVISGLTANTKYYYHMKYSNDGGSTWITRSEHTFQTQRAAGSTFTFDVTSDSHVNIQLGNSSNWTSTLNGVASDAPDFLVDLGDTFAMDNGSTSVPLGDTAAAEQKYKDQLPFFNIASASSATYIVPGNHEQQEAWHLQGTLANSLPVMGKNAEKKYFLNPVNDSFYTGDTSTYSYLSGDQLKQDYYAWTWGDALFVVISPFWTTTTKPYTTSTGGGETDATGSGNRWDWTLGQTQFNWLTTTLQNSNAKYKFVFAHQIVGGNGMSNQVNYGHGGVDSANFVEWGGYNTDGTTYTWSTNRSGWGSQPIRQMMEANGVTAFFHGHDHQMAYESLNDMVYQSVPSGSFSGSFGNYTTGGNSGNTIWADSTQGAGHLRVTVSPSQTTVDFIRYNGTTPAYTYTMEPGGEPEPGTVGLDGAVSSNTADDVSSINVAHTTGTGTDRLMLVGVSWNCGTTDRTISSVTFTPSGGSATALNLVRTQQAGTQLRYSAIYSLLNPPSGVSGTVTVTFSGSVSNGIVAGAANFTGVNQATPLGTPNSAGSTSQSTTPSVTLTGLSGDELVFDTVFQGATDDTQTLTTGAGQTGRWNAFIANVRAAASTEQATGSSVTMSWTAASSAYWAIAAVPINPASTVPTNQPPVVSDIPNQTIAEGATFTSVNLDDYVADPDNTDAQMTWTYSGNTALSVSITNRVATITTPNADWNGSETITFKATDPGALYDDDTATFTVTAVNDAPVITEGASTNVTMSEDGSPTAFSLTLNATDADGDTLTWSISSAASHGTATALGTGTSKAIGYTPTANYNGSDSFVVQVSDGNGGTDIITVNVTIQAVNDVPVITEGASTTVTMSEDGSPTAFSLTLNATDADGDTLTWSISSAASHGTATASGTGTSKAIGYTPTANYNDSDSFVVQVSDGNGGTDIITVNVTIQAVNDAPVAIAQSVSTEKNTAKVITLTGSDVEGSPLTYTVLTSPAHGALSGTAPNLTYTPQSGYVGSDSFTFKVNDGSSDSGAATVSITVTDPGVPTLPSSFWGEIHILDNIPVIGNIVEAYMPDVSGPAATTAISESGGDLIYSINVPAGAKGTVAEGDTITFKINGRIVATAIWHSGTNVHLDFHPPQALPGGPYTGDEDAAISFSGSANDLGTDVSTYQWDWDNDGIYDTTGQNPSHTWADPGSYPVGLKVTDAQGGEGTGTVTITVNQVYLTHSITLLAGWNLISFNVHPTNTNTSAVLSSLENNYDLVYAWDAAKTSDNWMKYDPSAPPFVNTLSSLDETMGFWIHMTVADILEVTGIAPTTTNIQLLDNAGGWNLVGYPSVANRLLPGALQGHGITDFTLVYAYHASDTVDPWKLFDPNVPPFANDLTQMTPGWGYWIKVNTDQTWVVQFQDQ